MAIPEKTSTQRRQKFRELMVSGPLLLPGVFSPFVAKMAERLGFEACYLSGGALSAGQGVPDVGLLSLTEFVHEARNIQLATQLPVIADADTGFGEVVNVERTVKLFEQAGIAGIHLEDQVLPKRCGHLSGKSLIDVEAMQLKIRAACTSRVDPNFVIIARTDARSVHGLDAAIERAQHYVASGADVIFPEALESEEEFRQFGREIRVPLLANMTEFGRSPLLPATTLTKCGFNILLYPLTAFRVAMKATETMLRELLNHKTQKDYIHTMLTRAELYEYLDYEQYEERDKIYFS